MTNLYDALGIPPTATADEIQKAYRSKAKTAHPDAGGSAEAFAVLTLARDTLLDEECRAIYDETGQTPHDEPELPAAVILIRNLAAECMAQNPYQNLVVAIREALGQQKTAAQSASRKYQEAIDEVTKRWADDAVKAQIISEFEQRRRTMEGQVKVAEAGLAMLKDSKYDKIDTPNPLMGSPLHSGPWSF